MASKQRPPDGQDLRARTKRFALDVVRLCMSLPKTREMGVFTGQLMRSATSVGANYRSANRARSKADFVNKISIVEEEADESVYWLEMIEELDEVTGRKLSAKARQEVERLKTEGGELTAIMVSSRKTARGLKQ